MGSFSIWHWLVVLVIVVIVFGTKRLRNVGQDLGEAVKGFKQGMRDEDPNAPRPPLEHRPNADTQDSTADTTRTGTDSNGDRTP